MLPRQPPVISVEAEVIGNIKAQPIGGYTVGDLCLSDRFLRRVADRVIRESFEGRFRIVVADRRVEPGASPPPTGKVWATDDTTIALPFAVVRHPIDDGTREYRARLAESRVEARGFRAAVLGDGRHPAVAVARRTEPEARAADHVAKRLALDGLLATTAAAINLLGCSRFLTARSDEASQLESIGIPVDLLRYFGLGASSTISGVIRSLAEAAAEGPDPAALKKRLSRVEFKFEPTCSGFVAATESGEMPATWFRVQLPGGEYWGGLGAGGGLDVLRQLVALLPEARYLVHVEERHLAGFAAAARDWEGVTPGRLTAVISDSAVSQWAQDNSKPGVIEGAPRLLLPRYASRAEDGPTFVPGDTFLADGLAVAGASVSQSPLLFQGGNVMMITRPDTGERVLLLGEGEIERHVSLGLTREHAVQAYRIEFGADRCEVLPAVSFHIDYELSVRAVGTELIALVPDERAGALIVLSCGLSAAARAGLIPPAVAEKAADAIRSGDPTPAVSSLGQVLASHAVRPGQVSESIAGVFRVGSADSGVGNVHRIMAAMDLMTAMLVSPSAQPAERHSRAYLQSLSRRLADRRLLHRQLVRAGMRIAAVPSVGEGSRALTVINGIQARGLYLMPAYGGLFTPLDRSAADAIGAALGPGTDVRQVLCGETQRRAGAVHCALSLLPDARQSEDVRGCCV